MNGPGHQSRVNSKIKLVSAIIDLFILVIRGGGITFTKSQFVSSTEVTIFYLVRGKCPRQHYFSSSYMQIMVSHNYNYQKM